MRRLLWIPMFLVPQLFVIAQPRAWQWQSPIPPTREYQAVACPDSANVWTVNRQREIWHSTNAGNTWYMQDVPLLTGFYGLYFLDSNQGWAVGGDYFNHGTILHTSDGGESWLQQSAGTTATLLDVYFHNSMFGWACGTKDSILFTTDGGTTWNRRIAWWATDSGFNALYFLDSLRGWAVGNYTSQWSSGFAVSATTNGGLSWQFLSSGQTPMTCVCFADSLNGWAGGQVGRIWHTTDGGHNWAAQTTGTNHDVYGIAFQDEQIGIAVGYQGLTLKTANGGNTWDPQYQIGASDFYGLSVHPPSTAWVVGRRGAIFRTTDFGTTWSTASHVTTSLLFGSFFSTSLCGWAVGYEGVVLHTSDGGLNWTRAIIDSSMLLNDVVFSSENNGWISGNAGSVFHTSNGGATWVLQVNPSPRDQARLCALSDEEAWITAGYGTASHTIDGGENWLSVQIVADAWMNDIEFINQMCGWAAGTEGTIASTENGGLSWEAQRFDSLYQYAYFYAITFADSINGWAGGTLIMHTSDGGNTWVRQYPELQGYVYDIEFADPLNGWAVGTFDSVLHTTNGGETWSLQGPSRPATTELPPFVELRDLAVISADEAWTVGYWGSILHYGVDQGIGLTNPPFTPSFLILYPNYPNPFNSTTQIRFDLPQTRHVELNVYDITGREVAQIADQEFTAGSHGVSFDASNLASGIYIYRLTANHQSFARKMVLLR